MTSPGPFRIALLHAGALGDAVLTLRIAAALARAYESAHVTLYARVDLSATTALDTLITKVADAYVEIRKMAEKRRLLLAQEVGKEKLPHFSELERLVANESKSNSTSPP